MEKDDKDTLVIFDSRIDLLNQLVDILQPYYRIRVAVAAKRAHELCILEPLPTLVLVGVSEVKSEGFSFCDSLRADTATSDLPIICVAAHDQAGSEEKAFSCGATDFIAQPFKRGVVLARVNNQVAAAYRDIAMQQKVQSRTHELIQSKQMLIHRLSCAAEYRDDETSGHIARMSRYSQLIAKGYGASDEWCERIFQASALHDIGKIGLSDSVLANQGVLNEQQRKLMQQHTLIGAEILGDDDEPLMLMSREIALGHHERYDGSGYPFGLKGEDISLAARIVAIADTFDALQAAKPYRKALTVEQAAAFISDNANILFDPILVDVFNHVMPHILRVRSQFSDELA